MVALIVHESSRIVPEPLGQPVSIGLGEVALNETGEQMTLQSEVERNTEALKISRLLVKDYYQTFRLSQGEPAVQPPLFKFIADEYRESTPSSVLGMAISGARVALDRLMPPAAHTNKTEYRAITPKDFVEPLWEEYVCALTDPLYDGNCRTMEFMLEDILAREVSYQRVGRPNRDESKGQDKYESIVREYILGDKLPGSEHLMKIRDNMRLTLLSAEDTGNELDIFNRLRSVAEMWEGNHPGQRFFEATHQVHP